MNDSILEIKLMRSKSVVSGGNVVFEEQTQTSDAISYNTGTGVITFNKTGKYLVEWWVATETTLKGAIGFELQSLQGSFASGCSPIKTGQVAGFAAIDVNASGMTMSLVNKSITDTIFSKKTGTKAYLLITPIGQQEKRVYRGDISTPESFIQVPLGNGLFYRLEYSGTAQARLVLVPMNGETLYDYRRISAFDGSGAVEGDYSDNENLNGAVTKDSLVYVNSREMHCALIRVQNPLSMLWSTYEVRFFASNSAKRVTVWVNVIEEEVSY